MARVRAVKGFRDILPEDAARLAAIEASARAVLSLHGYGEIRLPVLEQTELFARSIGETTDIVEKEMYSFTDRDGTMVTLRPEGTAGVVRAYVEHALHMREPVSKLCYFGPMFRRERPQKGRYRQFFQIGAELLGRDDPLADADLLLMVRHLLDEVGGEAIRFEIGSLGCCECRPAYREELARFGDAHRGALCENCRRRLARNPLRLLDCKEGGCRRVSADAPVPIDFLCPACRSHFGRVRELLEGAGLRAVVNPRLVRGLDYYCRTAFELVSEGLGAQNAVGGGGRYDGLVAAFGGPPVPGIGFALGLERLAMASGAPAGEANAIGVVVAPLAGVAEPAALLLAERLRRAGMRAELQPSARSLKSQLRRADRLGVRCALIVGEDELRAGRATVRDLVRKRDHPCALEITLAGDGLRERLAGLLDGVP